MDLNFSSPSLISATWSKPHQRVVLGKANHPLCSLHVFKPELAINQVTPLYTKVAVVLEGKESEIVVNINALSSVLGIKKADLLKKNPRELGVFLANQSEQLTNIGKAAEEIANSPYSPKNRTDKVRKLKETAEILSQAADVTFQTPTDLFLHLGNHLGYGSFGSVYNFKIKTGIDHLGFVVKLAHPRIHYLTKSKSEEEIARSIARAEADVVNEAYLLNLIHKDNLCEGIQLPPYKVFQVKGREDFETRVGYLGKRYDGNLLQDILVPGSQSIRSAILREFCTPRLALQLFKGLLALSEQEILHGDIKPQNVLVKAGPPPRVDLADFGGARTRALASQHWDCVKKLVDLEKSQIDQLRDLNYRLDLLEKFDSESARYKKLRKAANHLSQTLSETQKQLETARKALVGIRTRNYAPDEMIINELNSSTFEEYYIKAKRRDLYALGLTLALMLPSIVNEQDSILKSMLNYDGEPLYTIEKAAKKWKESIRWSQGSL